MADDTQSPAPTPVKRQFGEARKALPAHVAAGVQALRRWDDLYEVTDDELAAAVNDFNSIRLG